MMRRTVLNTWVSTPCVGSNGYHVLRSAGGGHGAIALPGPIPTALRPPAQPSSPRTSGLIVASTLVLTGLWAGLLDTVPGQAQWIEAPGRGWVEVSLYHHDTRKRFDPSRSLEPLFNADARAITTSLIVTGVVGVVRGADVWVQVPYNRLAFNDIAADRESIGIGDPRLHLRLGPELLGVRSPVPVAVRGGVKLPLGAYTNDAEIIPLSEGQVDWEVMLELGHSFYPAPFYVMGWAGYRWRLINDDINRKPGDERFAFAAVGGSVRSFEWKLAVEGLSGLAPRRQEAGVEFILQQDKRELFQILPSIGYALGPGAVSFGGRFPLAGRNLPAGPAVFIGYFVRFGV